MGRQQNGPKTEPQAVVHGSTLRLGHIEQGDVVRQLVSGDGSAKRALGKRAQDLESARLRIGGIGLAREDGGASRIGGRQCDELIDQRRGCLLVELHAEGRDALHRRYGVKAEDRVVRWKLIAGSLGCYEKVVHRVAVRGPVQPSHGSPPGIERAGRDDSIAAFATCSRGRGTTGPAARWVSDGPAAGQKRNGATRSEKGEPPKWNHRSAGHQSVS